MEELLVCMRAWLHGCRQNNENLLAANRVIIYLGAEGMVSSMVATKSKDELLARLSGCLQACFVYRGSCLAAVSSRHEKFCCIVISDRMLLKVMNVCWLIRAVKPVSSTTDSESGLWSSVRVLEERAIAPPVLLQ